MSTLKVGEIKHESFTGTTQLKLDSAGRLMVGTDTKGQADADDFTVANSGSGGITIRTGTSSNGNLFFSDATSGTAEYAGYIQYKHSSDRLDFGTATSTRMSIDSTGDIGLGTTSPNATGYASPVTSLGVTNNGYSVLELQGLQSSNGAVGVITGYNSSGNSRIATINWNRWAGNNYGSISFETANNGSLGERARITNDGLTFNGDTAAANALNDYEEGTFTPSFANVDNSVITVAHYNYTKVGRLVHINARFDIASNNDGSRFGFQLPFTQAGSRRNVLSAISTRSGNNTAPFAFIIDTNQSYAYANELDGFGDSQTAYATFAGDKIFVTGTYESN